MLRQRVYNLMQLAYLNATEPMQIGRLCTEYCKRVSSKLRSGHRLTGAATVASNLVSSIYAPWKSSNVSIVRTCTFVLDAALHSHREALLCPAARWIVAETMGEHKHPLCFGVTSTRWEKLPVFWSTVTGVRGVSQRRSVATVWIACQWNIRST